MHPEWQRNNDSRNGTQKRHPGAAAIPFHGRPRRQAVRQAEAGRPRNGIQAEQVAVKTQAGGR